MRVYSCVLYLLIYCVDLCSYSCFIDVKAEGQRKITAVKMLTERDSGSTYTEQLIARNFDLLIYRQKFGQKHFSPWFGREQEYFGPPEDYTFKDSESCLFVHIIRDPYDWLRSLYLYCPLAPESIQSSKSFSEFIRLQWGGVHPLTGYNLLLLKFFPNVDKNPINGQAFENAIKLRAAKIMNFAKVKERVHNYVMINYEFARDKPELLIRELASTFDLTLPKVIGVPLTERGNLKARPYKRKTYFPIDRNDLLYINNQLDKDLEESLGYKLREQVGFY